MMTATWVDTEARCLSWGLVAPQKAAQLHPWLKRFFIDLFRICLSPLFSLIAGMLMRWLMTQRGTSSPSSSKQPDEESGQPLLSASWEYPENNKASGKDGSGSSSSSSSSSEGPVVQQATVLELMRLSVPDTPVLLVAFVFGSAAALMAACVPYFTGLIIDYASIDPDRFV
jgi:hypothetical protein